MPTIADPQPISTFDPSRAALLHETLNDQAMAWDPERADDWRRTADPHEEGVHWDGYIFDAWGTEIVPAGAKSVALS